MSRLLVLLQFALILLLLLPFPFALPASPFGLALIAAGALLGGWTLAHNRLGNFNIHPEPKSNGKLITTGPYRWVRHPMYDAVLLVMTGWGFFGDDPVKPLYWVGLLIVLWIKLIREEALLRRQYPDYADYSRTTGRLLPRWRFRHP